MRRAALLLALVLIGCAPASGPESRWSFTFWNDAAFAQKVKISVGDYRHGVTAEIAQVVSAHDSFKFVFDAPPSFAYVSCGWGAVVFTWPGRFPDYFCPDWAENVRFPSGYSWGSFPVK